MRKFNLLLGIYFAFNLIWSIFFDKSLTDKILWIELNIWIVRLIWAVIATVLIYGYFNNGKSEKRKNPS
ncbi:hypothetical protein [Polaribacter sp.]|uniref:hypothetical protein n=1 Tax=Polaribacter sp. TaxID=1920175 RepID=UPI0040476F45